MIFTCVVAAGKNVIKTALITITMCNFLGENAINLGYTYIVIETPSIICNKRTAYTVRILSLT